MADQPPMLRECDVCGEDKPLTDFAPDKRRADGHRTTCLACAPASSRKRRRRPAQEQPADGEVEEWDTEAVPRFGFRARIDADTDSLILAQPVEDGEARIVLGRAEVQQLVDAVKEWLAAE
jgi:hypothetical protein